MHKPPVVVLAGVRWDFLPQRHHALAWMFSRAGHPTVFVETTGLANPGPYTLRKVAARLRRARSIEGRKTAGPTIYSPLVLPPTFRVFRRANGKLFVPRVARDLLSIVGPKPVVLAYPPTRTTLDLISALDPRLVLYDCSDDYEYFPGAPKDMAATEIELLKRADLVSCTSEPLLRKARRLRPDAFLSGPAVEYGRFAVLQGSRNALPPRTVCFFGHAGRERLDFRALREISRSGFRVRIVGDLNRTDRNFLREPNVEYGGEVPHEDLPSALDGVDAFVLPYRVNGLTRSISPAKTYECLATGRPVVAAPLPAMEELAGHVYLAREPGDYVRTLRALEKTETEDRMRARVQLAQENSWERRFAELEGRICRSLDRVL